MTEKNSLGKKFLALFLSVFAFVIFLPAIFTIPLEFLVMNYTTYQELAQDESILETGKEAIINYLEGRLSSPANDSSVAIIFSNEKVLQAELKKYISTPWLQKTLLNITDQLLQFFNFKKPFGIVEIDFTEIKENLIANSSVLVDELLNAYPPCSVKQITQYYSTLPTISEIQPCNPPARIKDTVVKVLTDKVEGFLETIPEKYQLNIEEVLNAQQTNSFISYSLLRWLFRVLPVFFLILLILIALCLKKNPTEMRNWIGHLLTISASFAIILILILLIGSEQFTAMFINKTISPTNSAFGTFLLKILQPISYKTLLWMAALAIMVFCIGFLILAINKGQLKRVPVGEEKGEIKDQKAKRKLFTKKRAKDKTVAVSENSSIEKIGEHEEKSK